MSRSPMKISMPPASFGSSVATPSAGLVVVEPIAISMLPFSITASPSGSGTRLPPAGPARDDDAWRPWYGNGRSGSTAFGERDSKRHALGLAVLRERLRGGAQMKSRMALVSVALVIGAGCGGGSSTRRRRSARTSTSCAAATPSRSTSARGLRELKEPAGETYDKFLGCALDARSCPGSRAASSAGSGRSPSGGASSSSRAWTA